MTNRINPICSADVYQTPRIFQNEEASDSSSNLIYQILTYSAYFLIQTINGVFQRVVILVWNLINIAFPNKSFFVEEITKEKITTHAYDHEFDSIKNFSSFATGKEPNIDGKLQYVYARVKEIAKQMQMTKEVDVYLTQFPMLDGSRGSSACFGDRIPIVFSTASLAVFEYDELDFMISRELSHVQNNSKMYEALYDIAVLVVEVALTIIYSAWLIPLIEGLSALVKIWVNRKIEKEAELSGVAVTGKESAKHYIQKCIHLSKRLRNREVSEAELKVANIEEGSCVKSMVDLGLKARSYLITKEGDCRLLHFTSNPFTERLKYIESAEEPKMSPKEEEQYGGYAAI